MRPEELLALARRILSTDVRERDVAADEVTDVMHDLGPAAPAIASLLALAAHCEQDVKAREAQLHTLIDMSTWDLASPDIFPLLRSLTGPEPDPVQADYLADLFSDGEA